MQDERDHIHKKILHTIIGRYDNPEREGLKDTPKRYLKFLDEFMKPEPFQFTVFDSDGYDEIVIVKDIPFFSLCEHHLAPFFGTATIAYLPKKKIVGLSKLPRTVDLYARRFQNQERITKQIADRLMTELNPRGVAVILKARHLCVEMRGIKKHNVETITSSMTGIFRKDAKARNEVLELIRGQK